MFPFWWAAHSARESRNWTVAVRQTKRLWSRTLGRAMHCAKFYFHSAGLRRLSTVSDPSWGQARTLVLKEGQWYPDEQWVRQHYGGQNCVSLTGFPIKMDDWEFSQSDRASRLKLRTSRVVQWIRNHLPMQGTWVRSLVQEYFTCCRATKSVLHSYLSSSSA